MLYLKYLFKLIIKEMQKNQESFLLIILLLSCIINFGIINPLWNDFHYRTPLITQTIFLMLIFFTIYVFGEVYLFNKKVHKYINKYMILYSIYLLDITFFKADFHHIHFIFNPLTSFFASFTLSPIALLNTFGNLFMYVPIGVYIRYKSKLEDYLLILFFIVFIATVEFLQGLSKVGVCDTNDMLTNTLSFYIGFRIVKWNLFSTDLKIFVSNIRSFILRKYDFIIKKFQRKQP